MHATVTVTKSASTTPQFTSASVKFASTCKMNNATSDDPVISWSTVNDTGVALSIDDPGLQGAFGTYGPSESMTPITISCSSPVGTVITHRIDLWTVGGTGPQEHKTFTVKITIVAP